MVVSSSYSPIPYPVVQVPVTLFIIIIMQSILRTHTAEVLQCPIQIQTGAWIPMTLNKLNDHLCIISNLPPYCQVPSWTISPECWVCDMMIPGHTGQWSRHHTFLLASSLECLPPSLPSAAEWANWKGPSPCPLCRLLNAEGDYCFEQSGLVLRLLSATWDVNILGILFTVPK